MKHPKAIDEIPRRKSDILLLPLHPFEAGFLYSRIDMDNEGKNPLPESLALKLQILFTMSYQDTNHPWGKQAVRECKKYSAKLRELYKKEDSHSG